MCTIDGAASNVHVQMHATNLFLQKPIKSSLFPFYILLPVEARHESTLFYYFRVFVYSRQKLVKIVSSDLFIQIQQTLYPWNPQEIQNPMKPLYSSFAKYIIFEFQMRNIEYFCHSFNSINPFWMIPIAKLDPMTISIHQYPLTMFPTLQIGRAHI